MRRWSRPAGLNAVGPAASRWPRRSLRAGLVRRTSCTPWRDARSVNRRHNSTHGAEPTALGRVDAASATICDRIALAHARDRRGRCARDLSRLTASAGTTTPTPSTATSWCRSSPRAFATSARCPSSTSTCTAAASTSLSALVAKVLPFTVFETRRLMGAVGRPRRAHRHLARRPARRRAACRPDRARSARNLPALCRPHLHERQGRPLCRRHGDPAARFGACLRGLSAACRPRPACSPASGSALAIGSRVLGAFGPVAAAGALALIVAIDARRTWAARRRLRRLGRFALSMLPVPRPRLSR